ncbi:hypothetical protein A1O7_06559 [Cladophialophora yegresii CBS 114405]|uniref:Xylanolytic transcriptional activator regulatory domain-containing protein n=1 Tax=Cladophialophora yegresii CBS 114405 TaxID=1182544 RepID=W9VU83_9EURO|nr:uncharacterized protein A1O7_06559 [Cladophialophora yegresii CBS 114405]EXJ59128.1 hypothetical protein A1O7_06559 [Cladophialophora yegresii CBS 114405]
MSNFHDESSGLMIGEHGQEYAGSSCGMSLATQSGLQWISQKAGNSNNGNSISLDEQREMVNEILSQLKLPTRGENGSRNRPQSNLPPIEVAKRYIDVYFAKQWLWPIIRESGFREHCERYWNDPASCDKTWYALYNVVLALGCRACLSSGTLKSFRDSENEAWAYFDNTVSVQSNLMYQKTSLQAVQTFALMTVFAQGVGGPQPEYIYCAIAVRFATGLGLHKSSPKAWHMSDLEIEDRNRLFWSLYCLDKTIAFRTGRPSLLDDSDIACPFPRDLFPDHHGEDGSHESRDFFLNVTRYSRICSRIIKNLYSTTSLMQTAEARGATVVELYEELKQWRRVATTDAGQDALQGWASLRETKMTSMALFHQRLVLEYFYHDCVASLDKARRLKDIAEARAGNTSLQRFALDQLAADSLESARSMCLLTQYIDIESYAPNWLVIYYPLTAIITIFTFLASNPRSSSATADIALMQCVLGLFGRIEYISSGNILLTKSGEFIKIVSSLVEKAKNDEENEDSSLSRQPQSLQEQQPRCHERQDDVADLHAPDRLKSSRVDSPFLQTQTGENNLPDDDFSMPYMADQFQSLNWLNWNFLQEDIMITR